MYDVIIIGAGAAGLMTAITAARGGVKVLLLDGQKKIGAKILMSGGTRCNVTNKTVSEKDFNSQQLMRVRNILRGFDNTRAIAFFKELGVELILEETNKYFPTTHSGKTVLDALIKECDRVGVMIKSEHRVAALDYKNEMFSVKGEGFAFSAKRVVLTTGGLSYPTTGSDGTGYRMAQSFGHQVLTTMPALTPLKTSDEAFKKLSGIALPVVLDLYVNQKKTLSMSGDFLFTHIGFSGPVVLDISRHWLESKAAGAQITVNFVPSMNEQRFDKFLQEAIIKHPKKAIKNFLQPFLPARLVEVLLVKAKINPETFLNQLTREERKALVKACTHYALETTDAVGYSKAEVTAGGVDLASVNPKTLESTLRPGLFFAGEIVDVDGRIGGFNFQWAWASGYTVGQALIKGKE